MRIFKNFTEPQPIYSQNEKSRICRALFQPHNILICTRTRKHICYYPEFITQTQNLRQHSSIFKHKTTKPYYLL